MTWGEKKTKKGKIILQKMATDEGKFLNSLVKGREVETKLKVERNRIFKGLKMIAITKGSEVSRSKGHEQQCVKLPSSCLWNLLET